MSSATGDSVDDVDGGVVGQDVGWSKFVTRLSPGVGPACCVDAFGGDSRRGSPGCVARSPSMASVRRRGNGRTGLNIISEVDAGYPGVVSVRRRVSFPRTVTAQAGVLRDVARRGLRPVAASKVVA